MNFLWGWSRPHTDITGVGEKRYSRQLASRTCAKSDLVVYKTVADFGRSIDDDIIPTLEAHRNTYALVPVRDPRAVYASWKERPWAFEGVSLLKKICDQHAANMNQKHPRLRRVVFERLVRDPRDTMEKVFSFLGFEFGNKQIKWIKQTFNATCTHTNDADMRFLQQKAQGNFTTCRERSDEPVRRWASVLTKEEIDPFANYASCREVAEEYGYQL